jgi:glycosyltransferase involved in cell wall biosynthesis
LRILFVMNFPPGTGYAWNTIERVLRGVAERLATKGHSVLVGYPALGTARPPVWEGAPVELMELEYPKTIRTVKQLGSLIAQIRGQRIDTIYLTDRPTWSPRYLLLRCTGVRRILVHDRTSGERSTPEALSRLIKRVLHFIPGLSASAVIGVSQFVAERHARVHGVPAHRQFVVYNGVPVSEFADADRAALTRLLGISQGTPVVFMSGRAQPYKGIETAIAAARLLQDQGDQITHFAFCGDGSGLRSLQALSSDLGVARFHFLGRREDIPSLLGSATVAVVPSHWGEAFGLTVVEAMAAGVPVVASAVGGIPELVTHAKTGFLVPPRDPYALATAIRECLDDPPLRARIGEAGKRFARERFDIPRVVSELQAVIEGVPGR